MTPALATTLVIVSVIGATASTATLAAGIVLVAKANKTLKDAEAKYEKAKEATKKFARSMADL